jgi:hypothetical protein
MEVRIDGRMDEANSKKFILVIGTSKFTYSVWTRLPRYLIPDA